MRTLALVVLLADCGVAADPDAGPLPDAGAPMDARIGEDAGEPPSDAGEADTGAEADGGPLDAGADATLPDSGTDAGPPPPLRVTKLTDHCALRSDGEVRCWGVNDRGQLGDGTLETSDAAVRPTLPGPASDLSCSPSHCCAIVDGAAWCWGANASGAVGRHFGETPFPYLHPTPIRAAYSGTAIAVGAGPNSTCVIDDARALHCWGRWLTEAPAATMHEPRTFVLNGGYDPSAIFVGSGTACAVARSPDVGGDALFCFGRNEQRQAHPFRSAAFLDVGHPAMTCARAMFHTLGSTYCTDGDGLYCWGPNCGLPSDGVVAPWEGAVWRADDVSGIMALDSNALIDAIGYARIRASDLLRSDVRADAFGIGADDCVTDGSGVYCPDPIAGVME